jgi:hypothetical protein
MLVLLLISAVFMTGCDRQDLMDILDIGRGWAQTHGLLDDEGKPEYFNIGMRAMGGSTGDDAADAVIDGGMVVNNFAKAEALRDEGFKKKDISKVDKAINLRPNEFRYHNDRASLLLDAGKAKEAEQEFANAREIAGRYGTASQIRNVDSRLAVLNANTEATFRYRMEAYRERYNYSKEPLDLAQANRMDDALKKGTWSMK